MHLEAVIDRDRRCAGRLLHSELRDAHGSCNRRCLEMHLEDVIKRVWRWI